MKLDEMSLKDRPKFMNMNDLCVFIPISDTESWYDWDQHYGMGGTGQLDPHTNDGIIVLKADEKQFRDLAAKFEEWAER